MCGGNTVVSAFPEYNRRIVSEINYGITHYLHTLVPLSADVVRLTVTRRLNRNNTVLVACTNIRRLSGDMHPTNKVCIVFTQKFHIEIIEPIRRRSDCRPLVCGTLCVTREIIILIVYVHTAVVRSASYICFSKACGSFCDIQDITVAVL